MIIAPDLQHSVDFLVSRWPPCVTHAISRDPAYGRKLLVFRMAMTLWWAGWYEWISTYDVKVWNWPQLFCSRERYHLKKLCIILSFDGTGSFLTIRAKMLPIGALVISESYKTEMQNTLWNHWARHNNDVIMSTMASQITSLTIVYSTVYSRRRSKKKSKLRVTGPCAGNSPETGEFTAQMASNAENVSIRWRHHEVALINQLLRHRLYQQLWLDLWI